VGNDRRAKPQLGAEQYCEDKWHDHVFDGCGPSTLHPCFHGSWSSYARMAAGKGVKFRDRAGVYRHPAPGLMPLRLRGAVYFAVGGGPHRFLMEEATHG